MKKINQAKYTYFDEIEETKTKSLAMQIFIKLENLSNIISTNHLIGIVHSLSLDRTLFQIPLSVTKATGYGGFKINGEKTSLSTLLEYELEEIKSSEAELNTEKDARSVLERFKKNVDSVTKQIEEMVVQLSDSIMATSIEEVFRGSDYSNLNKNGKGVAERLKENRKMIAINAIIILSYMALGQIISNSDYINSTRFLTSLLEY